MYESFLNLNFKSDDVKKDLVNAYGLHCKIHSYYDLYNKSDVNKIQYSLEYNGDGKLMGVLTRSNNNPDKAWVKLARAGYLTVDDEGRAFYTEQADTSFIKERKTLAFKVRLNTVEIDESGSRKPVDCIEWITNKEEDWLGFKIINVVVEHSGVDMINRPSTGQFRVGFSVLKGLLKVKDVNKVNKIIQCGLGREKAFGCGLFRIFEIQ